MDLTFILLRCVIIFNICGLVLGGWVSSFSKLTSSSRFLDDGPTTTIEKSETRRRASYEEGIPQQVSYPEPQAVWPLARVGYQYAINISFGDSLEQKVQNVIFDTGSRSLVLRECANLTANASLISQYQNCYHPTNGSYTEEGWSNDVYCLTIYIDQGIMSTEGCTVYTDKVRAGGTSAGSAGDLYVLSARTLASTDAALHPLGDVGGLLGGAFPAPGLGQSALTLLAAAAAGGGGGGGGGGRLLVGLNASGPAPALHLGGFPAGAAAALEWGAFAAAAAGPVYHTAHLHAPQVCGQDLLAGLSGHWPMLVDTGAACLSLPREFFSKLLVWLENVECVANAPDGIKRCYLNSTSDSLPVLTFRLTEEGGTLYLPLSDLLLDDGQEICLREDPSVLTTNLDVGSAETYVDPPPYISFGSLAVKSLYFAADFDAQRMGLANAFPGGGGGADRAPGALLAGCAAPAPCPAPSYAPDPRTNSCLPPDCGAYFFWRLDPRTGECRAAPRFLGAAAALLALAAAAEAGAHCLGVYLTAKAGRRLDRAAAGRAGGGGGGGGSEDGSDGEAGDGGGGGGATGAVRPSDGDQPMLRRRQRGHQGLDYQAGKLLDRAIGSANKLLSTVAGRGRTADNSQRHLIPSRRGRFQFSSSSPNGRGRDPGNNRSNANVQQNNQRRMIPLIVQEANPRVFQSSSRTNVDANS